MRVLKKLLNILLKSFPMFDVVHIITTIERGGAENQLLILVREQVTRGLKIAVIPLKGRAELQQEFLNLGVVVFSEFTSYSLFDQIHACKKIASETRIVHCHLPRAELIGALVSSRTTLVVSRHNTEPFFPGAPKLVSRYLSRFVFSRAKGCIAISKAVADYLVASSEIPKISEAEIILYGFDNEFSNYIDPRKDIEVDLLARLQESKLVVTTIGRLTAQKDYPTLFSAFALILKTEPNSILLVIGEGELLLELKEMSKVLGISNQIVWVGKTKNVASYLSISDVFVLTSKYEGFGLVLLESMSLNVPIIASNNSAIREVLTPEHRGLVDTGDQKEFASRILDSRSEPLRSAILKFQSKRFRDFSPQKMELDIFRLYSRLTNFTSSC